MLKKTITYTDFNGVEQTEDHYFNLGKGELTELAILDGDESDISGQLKKIAESNDGKVIINTFKDIVRKAYGIKSEDGKRFVKSEQISTEFEQTAAYDKFFYDLVTDSGAAVAFIQGIVPADLSAQVQEKLAEGKDLQSIETEGTYTASESAPQPSAADIQKMLAENPELLAQITQQNAK